MMKLVASKLGFTDLKTFNAAIEKDPKLPRPFARGDPGDLPRSTSARMKPKLAEALRPPAEGRPRGGRRSRSSARRRPPARSTTRGRRTGRGPAGSWSTPASPSRARRSRWSPPRTTRESPGITSRSRSPRSSRTCRRSASRASTRRSSRAGRSTPRGSARRSGSTRTPTATTAGSRTRCCGRSGSSWTPASTRRSGPATRSSQFFHDHSAVDEVEVQSETDRYISWPGQALAYKIGQLKILELRERAQEGARDRSSTSARFHDAVLGAGRAADGRPGRRGSTPGSPRRNPARCKPPGPDVRCRRGGGLRRRTRRMSRPSPADRGRRRSVRPSRLVVPLPSCGVDG